MIRLDGVALALGSLRLHDVSLEIPSGGYGLIIGPTGSGKTSLLECIAGHVAPASGRIALNGRDVTAEPPERRGIGFVYQAYHLFPHHSVRENIAYGLARRGRGHDEESRTRVEDLAALFGIGPLLDRGIRGLSGGEQQRVALARALAPRPGILLLDEPLAAVDPALRRTLRRELRQIQAQEGVTVLHVTHDVEDALRLGDEVAVLADGGVIQRGPPEEVFRYPKTPFVAQFLDAGNVLRGTVTRQGPSEGDPPRFAATFRTGGLVFDVVAEREGATHVLVRPEDLLITRDPVVGPPRNRFGARIERLERRGPVTLAHLDASGTPLVASITSQTAEELGLAAAMTVAVGLKATAVHLF